MHQSEGLVKNGPDGALVFEVDVQKPPGARLGIDVGLVSSSKGCGLVVENIAEGGLIEVWNRRSREPLRIRPGDLIVRVNGIEGEISALASELRSGKDLHIMVHRAVADEVPQWRDMQAMANNRRREVGLGSSKQAASSSQRFDGFYGAGNAAAPGGPPVFLDSAVGAMPRASMLGQCPAQDGASWMGRRANPAPSLPMAGGLAGLAGGSGLGGFGHDHGLAGADSQGHFRFEVLLHKPPGRNLGIDVLPGTEFGGLSVKRVSKGGVVDHWNMTCREAFAIRPDDCIISVNGIVNEFPQMMEELRTESELQVTIFRRNNPVQPGAGGASALLAGLSGGGGWAPQGAGTGKPLRNPGGGAGNRGLGGADALGAVPPASQLAMARRGKGHGGDGQARRQGQGSDQPLTFEVELDRASGTRLGIDVMFVTGSGLCGLIVERVAEGGAVESWNQRSRPPYRVQAGDYIISVNGRVSGFGHWQDLNRMSEEFARGSRQVRFTVQRGPPQAVQQSVLHQGGRQQAAGGRQGQQQQQAAQRGGAHNWPNAPAAPPPAPGFAARDQAAPARGGYNSGKADPEAASVGNHVRPVVLAKAPPPPPPMAPWQLLQEQGIDVNQPFEELGQPPAQEGMPPLPRGLGLHGGAFAFSAGSQDPPSLPPADGKDILRRGSPTNFSDKAPDLPPSGAGEALMSTRLLAGRPQEGSQPAPIGTGRPSPTNSGGFGAPVLSGHSEVQALVPAGSFDLKELRESSARVAAVHMLGGAGDAGGDRQKAASDLDNAAAAPVTEDQAQLLLITLQLSDEDLTQLLQRTLKLRPELARPVAEALGSLKEPTDPLPEEEGPDQTEDATQ